MNALEVILKIQCAKIVIKGIGATVKGDL